MGTGRAKLNWDFQSRGFCSITGITTIGPPQHSAQFYRSLAAPFELERGFGRKTLPGL